MVVDAPSLVNLVTGGAGVAIARENPLVRHRSGETFTGIPFEVLRAGDTDVQATRGAPP
jgi:hypothetical protein